MTQPFSRRRVSAKVSTLSDPIDRKIFMLHSMPAPVSPRRRSRTDYESDDPGDASSEPDSPEQSSSSRKRARLSNETSLTSPIAGTPMTNSYHAKSDSLQRETLQARSGRRKHQPGSIVRVKLTNFVTYTAVEFYPGPSLNMVIGPNGTGKSTLICAICLGLGWGPQVETSSIKVKFFNH